MKSYSELEKLLFSIDGQGYSSYKNIKGKYNFNKYILSIDHVQSDPFAPPSKARIIISRKESGFPEKLLDSKHKIIAASDFLTRTFYNNIKSLYTGTNGTGKSGLLTIDSCGQEILERTSIIIDDNNIEARFEIGLPASGRKILGKAANKIFSNAIPKIVDRSLIYKNIDQSQLENQIKLVIDQEYIRNELNKRGLVAFIANGSILPRENGISQNPLKNGQIPFKSPSSFEIELTLPNHGSIKGMGIPNGITLIVGGGYHGKSTLLKALELGIYNHIAGDGREFVITRGDAVKIRAEDGRRIEKVDISPFIKNLPNNKDTVRFCTENASGSTSQAANVMEAIESNSKLLLIDEDTSATNFMIRDEKMQKLVKRDKEPITPFIDRIKQLYKESKVSTILVMGGSGDYFDIADQIIMMDEYVPKDVTKQAKEIANESDKRQPLPDTSFKQNTKRIILKSNITKKGRINKIKAKGKYSILWGKSLLDLSNLEQIADTSQTNCIAVMLDFLWKNIIDNKKSVVECVDELFNQVEKFGLDSISTYNGHPGNLALPRKYELCAAINRYRGLKVK